jgi:SnoaL-like domain
MVNNNLSTLIEDDHQIASLLIRWGYARDSDDWETLAGCFHDDATIHNATGDPGGSDVRGAPCP